VREELGVEAVGGADSRRGWDGVDGLLW